jgi:hypothetical protein
VFLKSKFIEIVMTKTVFLVAIAITAFAVGTLASSAFVVADGEGKGKVTSERDNIFITGFSVSEGDLVVLLDNAGIGGTSSVELTWRLDSNCVLVRVDGTAPALGLTPIVDEGELGGNPAHSDQANAGAIVLTAGSGTCAIDSSSGEYISISTVGSTKKG